MELHAPARAMNLQRADTSTHPIAGVLAGLVAGAAYLGAQMMFAVTVHDGSGWEPLQRMGAMLLGDEAAPPGRWSGGMIGISLLIHFGLAIVYGRLVDSLVRGRPLVPALVRGAAFGLLLYGVNYWLIAPVAFPWFAEGRSATALLDHVLFGAVAAGAYVVLRRRQPRKRG
jgi:hypothetical protein